MTETHEMALPLRPTHEFYHFSIPTFVRRRRRGVAAAATAGYRDPPRALVNEPKSQNMERPTSNFWTLRRSGGRREQRVAGGASRTALLQYLSPRSPAVASHPSVTMLTTLCFCSPAATAGHKDAATL